MSNTDINTAPKGCELLAPGVARKETRNGNFNYFVRCPGTGEWMFRHQKAFDQLVKRYGDLTTIGTSVYSRTGKLRLERENPELFAELFPKQAKKATKPVAKKATKKKSAVKAEKAKEALAKVEPVYEDKDDIDVEVSENDPVEALELDETFEEDDYEDIYEEIDARNLTDVIED